MYVFILPQNPGQLYRHLNFSVRKYDLFRKRFEIYYRLTSFKRNHYLWKIWCSIFLNLRKLVTPLSLHIQAQDRYVGLVDLPRVLRPRVNYDFGSTRTLDSLQKDQVLLTRPIRQEGRSFRRIFEVFDIRRGIQRLNRILWIPFRHKKK